MNILKLQRGVVITFPILLVILILFFVKFSDYLYKYLLMEDGFLESSQFIIFFIAYVIGFMTALESRRNKLYFLLFLIFSMCCAIIALDEISWGQRLFKFSVSEFYLERNLQLETNIHNLDFIHYNYLHHKAYIFIGLYGSFAWLLIKYFRFMQTDFFYFVTPKLQLFFYFFPIALYFIWLDYLSVYYWPSIFKELDITYVYRLQEVFETNLALGFLLVSYFNYKKVITSKNS